MADERDQELAELRARLARLEAQPERPVASPATEKVKSNRKATAIGCGGVLALLLVVIVGASMCSGSHPTPATNETSSVATPTADAPVAETSTPATPRPPEPPTHHWSYQENGEYGYQSALSDEDQKSGKATADVHMFRYLGKTRGLYTVESVDDEARVFASCSEPCEVVKLSTALGGVKRIAFNPDSIVGGALADAMSGQMRVYKSPGSTSSDDAGNASE